MLTFLVTGSEGNIGPFLIDKIRKKFFDALIIRVAHHRLAKVKENNNIIVRGDLNDKNFVDQIFREHKVDYIIYAATPPYNFKGFKQPENILSNEVRCLSNVLNNCGGVKKIVYLSSVLVYESSNVAPFTEELTDKILPPESPYGLAKHFGEKAIKLVAAKYNIPYTIWRAYNVVSPLEDVTTNGHVYMDFYRKIYLEKAPCIEIFGTGRQTRSFTWVGDLVEGIVDFLDDPKTDNQIFNIGGEESKTLIELKDKLIGIGKEKEHLEENYDPQIITGKQFYGADDSKRFSSLEKIKSILGWKPATSFDNCFRKFVEYKQKYDNT